MALINQAQSACQLARLLKIEEENGHPSADVWFWWHKPTYNVTSSKGLLSSTELKNASHLISDKFKSK